MAVLTMPDLAHIFENRTSNSTFTRHFLTFGANHLDEVCKEELNEVYLGNDPKKALQVLACSG